MRAIRCLLAAGLAAGIMTVVMAQPGGFGRGFGQVDVATAVIDNKALHEELKITDAQKEKFKGVAAKKADLDKKRAEMFGKGGKGFDKDKATELREEGTKLNEEIKKVVDEALTADQKKRLKQISIQVAGLNAFADPEAKGTFLSDSQKDIIKEVDSALKLTDKQRTAIKEIVADFNKDRREINKEAGIGGFGGGKGKRPDQEKVDAANKQISKLQKESFAKIEEALDDTQKKTWKELVGEAFDTSKLRPPPPKKD